MSKHMHTSSIHRPIHKLASSIAALIIASTSPSAFANLVANGGFEAGATNTGFGSGVTQGGGGYTTLWTTPDPLPFWDVGPTVDPPTLNGIGSNSSEYFITGAGYGVGSGNVSAVFPNFPVYDGYISQAINGLTIGVDYVVSFRYSAQVGDYPQNSLTANWGGSLIGDSIVGGINIFGPSAIPVPQAWTTFTTTITATATTQRLSFIGGADAAGILIDDVVVDPVPEPASIGAMAGFALLAMGSMFRIRRASSPLLA